MTLENDLAKFDHKTETTTVKIKYVYTCTAKDVALV